MEKLFYPGSVMVFGVSSAPTNLARIIIDNLDRFGFKGAVYPIGREGGEINGRKILKGTEGIKGTADLAVILLPARAVPEALEACGRKCARYVVILSAGFSEFGDEGKNIEADILRIAQRWGIRLVGPNCLGHINTEHDLVAPFIPLSTQLVRKGSLSLMAQSGGVMFECMKYFAYNQIGFNKLVSMGNKLDLNENDYLEFMISDPGTKTIALHMENISEGRCLMDLSGGTDKPIIVLKVNRGSSSHQIARFHTSALAGDDVVADSAFMQAGMHRVQNMQEMIDCIKIFSLPLLRGPNLAVFARSGGLAVMMADAVHHYGLKLTTLSKSFFDLAQQGVRAGVIRMTNPLDLGDVYDINFYIRLMENALEGKNTDGLVISHLYRPAKNDVQSPEQFIQACKRLSEKYGKPVVLCLIPDPKDFFQINQAAGYPIFAEVDHAIKALSISYRHSSRQDGRAEGKGFKGLGPVQRKKKIQIKNAGDIFAALKRYHMPTVEYAVAATEKDVLSSARNIGYPVALKTAALEITHKTEAGGVKLNLTSPRQLKIAFKTMVRKLKMSGLDPVELILQKMAPRGQEVFIGGKQDPEFGPVILFGLGGIFVEVLRDVVMRVAPIDRATAHDMIGQIKGAELLRGFRGLPACDIDALSRCLVNASRLIADHPEIGNLDINPLIVLEKGKDCLIVDAKMDVA